MFPKIGMGPKLAKWTRISLGIAGIIFLAIGLYFPPQESVVTRPVTPTPTVEPTPTSTPTPSLPAFTPIDVTDAFYPSGWMGDRDDITFDDSWTENPHSKPTSIKITYSAASSQGEGWAGIYWQYPSENWGDKPEGRDSTGATKLTFWARGEKGGEKAKFKAGGITGKYPDWGMHLTPVSTISCGL